MAFLCLSRVLVHVIFFSLFWYISLIVPFSFNFARFNNTGTAYFVDDVFKGFHVLSNLIVSYEQSFCKHVSKGQHIWPKTYALSFFIFILFIIFIFFLFILKALFLLVSSSSFPSFSFRVYDVRNLSFFFLFNLLLRISHSI